MVSSLMAKDCCRYGRDFLRKGARQGCKMKCLKNLQKFWKARLKRRKKSFAFLQLDVLGLTTCGEELSSFCSFVVKSSGSTCPSISPWMKCLSFWRKRLWGHISNLYQTPHIPGDALRLSFNKPQKRCQKVLALHLRMMMVVMTTMRAIKKIIISILN